MLSDVPVMITFSVDDFAAAKKFYGDVLGLTVDDSTDGMLTLKLKGGPDVWIYQKKTDHVPAGYTLLNFTVSDIKKAMDDLKARGVKFEQYDLPNTKSDKDGLVDYGVFKIAFFNDPAGNNHAVMQMESK
jgi:catechol 2,3-dioxygenase-like lactoylglutathione lyase family enzyme